MVELVLSPSAGQFAVHTPFLIRKDQEIFLFYAQGSHSTDNPRLRRQYKICYATSRDGKNWNHNSAPIISVGNQSVCRPWIISTNNGYRMYFVKTLPSPVPAIRFRICTATSSDLRNWQLVEKPVIDSFDGLQHIASPCIVNVNGKIRMFFSGARKNLREDKIFVAESDDGIQFTINKTPKYSPKVGSDYEKSCYTPYIFQSNGGWKMLFSGAKEEKKYRTFIAESTDGLNFSEGRLLIDLASDNRFVYGAYKAFLFEDNVYFVGIDAQKDASIYRMKRSELNF